MTDVAACPRCARTLRLVTPPTQPYVLTHCPACGDLVVLAYEHALVLVDAKRAASWRFRSILHDQRVDIAASAGSALASGAGLAALFVASGHIVGAIASVVAGAVAGAGMGTSVAVDARAGAAMWRQELTREEALLVLQPDGYRA